MFTYLNKEGERKKSVGSFVTIVMVYVLCRSKMPECQKLFKQVVFRVHVDKKKEEKEVFRVKLSEQRTFFFIYSFGLARNEIWLLCTKSVKESIITILLKDDVAITFWLFKVPLRDRLMHIS